MNGAKIKPLEWHNFDAWTHWSEGACGTYHVEERNGYWQVELRVGGLVHGVTATDDTTPADLDAAKAAAQADYEARILAALEPAEPQAPTAQAEALDAALDAAMAKVMLARDAAIAAIARHLAPGDELVAQATAAMEGVTPGKPCQFHPSFCKEAEGTPFSEWDSSHDLSVILPDGKRYKIGHFRHSADAGFDQFARQWVPEAADRISALTAQVADARDQRSDAEARMETAETELATLRDRLARMECDRF